ncbi:MAG: ABC transporter permease [Pseudomonadales bacterium]
MKLAMTLLWRDWRGGELTLLLASLIVAVGTVTTITLFVDRLQQALVLESASFIAADRVISSSRAIDPAIINSADDFGLARSETLSFLSMVFSEERAQLAAVKAVDDQYPLRGELLTSGKPFGVAAPRDSGPAPGRVFMESRLFPSLDIEPGAAVDVGVLTLPAATVLLKEPDRGGGFDSVAPRLLMHLSDVPATEIVQPGSRVTYRYLFAGSTEALAEWEASIRPQLPDDARLFGVKEGAEQIGEALDKAEQFLLLGGLLGVVLAGVAIALSANRYAVRHFDHVAILKTLGAAPRAIDRIYLFIFLVLGLLATVFGALCGFIVQALVAEVLAPLLPVALPAPSLVPIGLGLTTGMVCLLSFALPPLLALRNADPVRVIRRDLEVGSPSTLLAYSFGGLGTFGLMWWYSKDLTLTFLLFTGGLAAALLLGSIALLLVRSGRGMGLQAGSAWRLAIAGLRRRQMESALQILTFGLALMLLLTLFLVRTSLLDEWRDQIPEDAPNHFAMNILPDERLAIRRFLGDSGVSVTPEYPMIRGRITAVNDQPLAELAPRAESDRGAPRLSSSRNLTAAEDLPKDNDILEGLWWDSSVTEAAEVSVEEVFARSNGLKLGDILQFEIEGRQFATEVTSVRSVDWDNMQPNFYLIFSPKVLDEFPSTFMTSFFLDPEQKIVLSDLLRKFPTMTVLEVDALIEQIRKIVDQVTLAVEFVLVLILISGAMVLLASIQASLDERMKQFVILRTLGASNRLVRLSLALEFAALGAFAGLLAALGSEMTVFGLEREIFELSYSPTPWLWVLGPILGAVLIAMVGMLATRKVLDQSPVTVLRGLA